MARYKQVDNERVLLTAEEETERDAQIQAAIDNYPNEVREERDRVLASDVDPIVSNSLRWDDMTDAKQTEWTQYRTDLLNLPEQSGFPIDITWPTKPE